MAVSLRLGMSACVQEHKSVLVFCGTRPNVEHTASEIAQMCEAGLFTISERATVFNSGNSASKRSKFLADLPKGTPPTLLRCLQVGVGYHHAGTSSSAPPVLLDLGPRSSYSVMDRIARTHGLRTMAASFCRCTLPHKVSVRVWMNWCGLSILK